MNKYVAVCIKIAMIIPTFSSAQSDYFIMGNREYKMSNGEWYTYTNESYGDKIIPNRLIVHKTNNSVAGTLDFNELGIPNTTINSYPLFGQYYIATLSDVANPFDCASIIYNSSIFDYVEFDAVMKLGDVPNDPYFNDQWNLQDDKLNMETAWEYTTGTSNIIVAIIDAGVEWEHPDLNGHIWNNQAEVEGIEGVDDDGNNFIDDFYGWNFHDNNNDPHPDYNDSKDYHGTAVSGIVAASTNNNEGISGIAGGWSNAYGILLMLLRLYRPFPPDEEATVASVAQCIRYASENGSRVINLSLGWQESYQYIEETIDSATFIYDCVIVAASGNMEKPFQHEGIRYPAKYDNVIAVGATLNDDSLWDKSEYGLEIDVVAPGGYGIWTTDLIGAEGLNGNYRPFGGTSAAAPHVTGLVSLIRSMNNSLNFLEIKNIIELAADDLGDPGWDQYYGWGRINASEALHLLPPSPPQNFIVTGDVGDHPTLHWSLNSEPDIVGYNLYKNEANSGWSLFHTVGEIDSFYTDPSVTIGIGGKFSDNVCYKITALDDVANESEETFPRCKPLGSIRRQTTNSVTTPMIYSLNPNFPNPFNPSTTITYGLPEDSRVELRIYDLMGRQVRTLVSGDRDAGYQSVTWAGLDDSNGSVATGIYIFRISAISLESEQTFTKTGKMVLMR